MHARPVGNKRNISLGTIFPMMDTHVPVVRKRAAAVGLDRPTSGQ